MKKILVLLIALTMILSLTACQNGGQSEAISESQEESEPDYGSLEMFSLPKVEPGKAELVTTLELENGGELCYLASAESGTGFFIACLDKEEKSTTISIEGKEWLYYYEFSGKEEEISDAFPVTHDGIGYFYVGSLGETVEYISGNIDWTTAFGMKDRENTASN